MNLRTLIAWTSFAGAAAAQALPPLAESTGNFAGERRGSAVARAGDLDSDGREDFWVGSPFDPTAAVQAGAVRAISGRDGATLRTAFGSAALDHFGWALANVGDIDLDGMAEVAVGAPDADFFGASAGEIRILRGSDASLLRVIHGVRTGAQLGYALSAAGDLDGDGFGDLFAGAPFDPGFAPDAGSVESFSPRTGASLGRIEGSAAGDRLGIALAGVGDTNGDGRGDCLVGADQSGVGTGYARLYAGPNGPLLRTWGGTANGERFGAAVCGGLDFDGDGSVDVALGAPQALAGRGRFAVFSGADGSILAEQFGATIHDSTGVALSMLPDLDGDGRADVLCTSLVDGAAVLPSGIVRAFGVRSRAPLIAWRGTLGGDRFGAALDWTADQDGDGVVEIVVGAPKHDGAPIDCGGAFVLSTRLPRSLNYCSSKLNSLGCEPRMDSTGFASLGGQATLELRARRVVSHRLGLFLIGRSRASLPFAGATLCVAGPLQRSAASLSSGPASPVDCSGVLHFALDGAWLTAHGWSAGELAHAQAWYRDPQHPDGTASGLSDALEFTVWL